MRPHPRPGPHDVLSSPHVIKHMPIHRVLILSEEDLPLPGSPVSDQALRTALENSSLQIEVYREYLGEPLVPRRLMSVFAGCLIAFMFLA
jgi:hypothetical protein